MHDVRKEAQTVDSNEAVPYLIIAGVNKAATTSLYTYLSSHPSICAAKIKEVQYFLPVRYGKPLEPIEAFWEQFADCDATGYRMEATGGYFYGGRAVAEAIRARLEQVKLVFIFREPISRLFSYYKFKKSSLELDPDLSFAGYVRRCESLPPDEVRKRENNVYWGIEGGFYADYLDDWFAVFPAEDIKILFFDDLVADVPAVLRELCLWLGIDHESYLRTLDLSVENKGMFYKNRGLQRIALQINWYGETFWRRHPALKRTLRRIYYAINGTKHEERMSPETRAYLESLFAPKNAALAAKLRAHGYEDLPAWLAQEQVGQRR